MTPGRLPRMHAASLRYILRTAELGSIRRASEELNVAASAINRHILLLERDLGTPLFERHASGVGPTQAGAMVADHARETLAAFRRTMLEVSSLSGEIVGEVRIVALASLMDTVLPPIAVSLVRAHRHLDLRIVEAHPDAAARELAAGRYDAGVFFADARLATLEAAAELRAPIGAVMRADHPLAVRERVTLTECADYGAAMFAERWMIADLMSAEFARTGAELRARITSNGMAMLRAAVCEGVGIGFTTPIGFLDEIRAGTIVHRAIAPESAGVQKLGVFVRRGALSPPVRTVVERIRSAFASLQGEIDRATAAEIRAPRAPD